MGYSQSSFYDPPDRPEGEVDISITVNCSNDQCADFDVATDVDLLATYYGTFATGDWACPTCGEVQTAEFELDEDFGYDPDEYHDRLGE